MKVGVQVDPALYYELKKCAATRRVKLYVILNEVLSEYLDRHKGESR